MGIKCFQYAFGKHLALKHQTALRLDLGFLLDRSPKKLFVYRDFDLSIFDLEFRIAQPTDIKPFGIQRESPLTKFKRICRQKRMRHFYPHEYYWITEPSFHFNDIYLDLPKNAYLEGFWQSEQYFKQSAKEIRRSFTFKHKLNPHAKDVSEKIKSVNAVCVNIRRGFVNNIKERLFHGFLGLDYFDRAAKIIIEKVKKPHFFLFSDDLGWCKQNIKIPGAPVDFITHDCSGIKFNNYLQLMIECDHFIIPNSSFGWWAAWLCENPKKVIVAPKRWFRTPFKNTKDLVPKSWIRI